MIGHVSTAIGDPSDGDMAAADDEGDREAALKADDPQLALLHCPALRDGFEPLNKLGQPTDEGDGNLFTGVIDQICQEFIDIVLSLDGIGDDVAHRLDRSASSLIRASKCACAASQGIVSFFGSAITRS